METLIHFLCVMKLKRGGGPIDVQDTDGRAGSDQRDGRTWIVRASVKNDIKNSAGKNIFGWATIEKDGQTMDAGQKNIASCTLPTAMRQKQQGMRRKGHIHCRRCGKNEIKSGR